MNNKTIILILGGIILIGIFAFAFFKKEAPIPESNVPYAPKANELAPQEGLPPKVEDKRQAIYRAAISRDYEKLARETSPNFHYSFGGEYEGGFVGYLKLSARDEGNTPFNIIPTLLRLPYGYQNNIYSWPYVYTIEPSKWTEADIALMKTFLTDEQIESFRQFGGYAYYRLGITEEGEWIFYIAGD